jgi:hypothetical protein
MDEYTVDIDELHDDAVVLAVPALRVLVFGRSLEDALNPSQGVDRFPARYQSPK